MTQEQLWLYMLGRKSNIIITDIQLLQLTHFKELILDWNRKINLISRKNEENLWKGHIALSLSLLFKVSFLPGARILDLGTGGGLPGIPLAILLPECSFVLLDSTQKKITAVQSMTESLSLHNVKTLWGRAEEIHQRNEYASSFDVVVARSVSNLSNLAVWGMPFLKKHTGKTENHLSEEKVFITTPSLITFKGTEIEEEELVAHRSYPDINFRQIPLVFKGSEEFEQLDKKLIIATIKKS